MIKTIIVLLTMFSLSFNLVAQDVYPPPKPAKESVKVGPRMGLSLSGIPNFDAVGSGASKIPNLGPIAGIVVSVPITNKLAIQSEVLFNTKGSSVKASNYGYKEKYSLNLFYLDIPIIVKGYFGKKSFKGIVGTGPQVGVGLFLFEVASFKANGQRDRESLKSGWPEVFNRFEFAWDAEFGVRFDLDNATAVEVTLRPSVGLTSLTDTSFGFESSRNISAAISVAVLFGK